MSKRREYTREEQELLDYMVTRIGQKEVDKFAQLILDQGRSVGELPEREDEPTIVVDNGVTLTEGKP
jgi:hypothetical protein